MSVNVRFNPVKRPVLQFYIRRMRNDPLKDNAHWRQQENLLFGNIGSIKEEEILMSVT